VDYARKVGDLWACWKRWFSQNDFKILWNVIPLFNVVPLEKKGTIEVSMIMRRRVWIYYFVFLNPSLSGSLLTPFSISLRIILCSLFSFLILLGVFLLYTSYVLGLCPLRF